MSNSGDPEFLAEGTVEPDAVYVVSDPEVVVAETEVEVAEPQVVVAEPQVVVTQPAPTRVEPEPLPEHPFRWLWWLLGLLALAALTWALVHRCEAERVATCTAVPDSVFDAAAQASALDQLEQWLPGVSAAHHDQAVATLRDLCNLRLSHTGYGNWFDGNAIQNAFTAIAPNMDAGVTGDIRNLIERGGFCHCAE